MSFCVSFIKLVFIHSLEFALIPFANVHQHTKVIYLPDRIITA